MDQSLRQSVPARISAVGFIIVVIFGNLWLVHVLLGQAAAQWTVIGFVAGTAIALVGGAALLALGLYRRLTGAGAAPPGETP